jgi:pimeloyl-ACP methyl ester carboxylesterase/DNA-binding CsgD family transcriptional regulator
MQYWCKATIAGQARNLANSSLETQHRKLIADIESALEDPAGPARLAGHLQDLPRLLQDMEDAPRGDGQMVMLVDKAGQIVSQNAAAARKLGLSLGDAIHDIALTPEAASRFLAACHMQGPVTLAIAAPSGSTVFLLGQATEAGGPLILTEVQRGISADVRARIAAAIGLIPSEAQLLEGLLQGRPVDQIAQDLGRKEGTVRQQIKSIMGKMGVRSQSQMVSTAYALSLMHERSLASHPASPRPAGAHHGAELFDGAHGTVGLHSLGPDDGLPVLLLHGAIFGIAAFAPMRMAAETLGLRLIAPERPGFGNTLFPADGDAVSLCVAQTLDLLDHLGLPRVVVLAHDIGTRFAARLALHAPGRVAAVVAAPATPPMQTWAQTADMPTRHRVNAWAAQHMPGLMDKIVALGLRQIARSGIEAIPRLVFDGCDFDQAVLGRAEAAEALQEGFHLAWAQQGVGFRHDMRLTNENWLAEARRIAVPFLCLHGENSRTVSRKAVEDLALLMPQGRFRPVPDAGHSLPLSHPALLLRAAMAAGHSAGMGLDAFGF